MICLSQIRRYNILTTMASETKGRQLSQGEKKIEKYIYSMNHLLGKGSYASVFLGRLTTNDTAVAVKVIEKRIFANHYNLKNIHSEIDIMKKLEHQNIVRLLDVYQTSNNMYIVTEFCEGGDLRSYLKRRKKLTQAEAVAFLKDIVRGFEYMNKLDTMHRDLKPANILIHQNKLKISDFGFARSLDNGDSTILKSIVGTPLYMSPQLLNQQQYTNKSDLWSVGLIFYEMLHGFTPWPANNQLQLINNINCKPIVFDPAISETSKDFIRKCLRKKEEDRMSWEEAFAHPVLGAGISPRNATMSPRNATISPRRRQEKENRTPRQLLIELKEKDNNRSKSKSVSARKVLNTNNTNKTPTRPRQIYKNTDFAADRMSPWRM